LVASESSTVAIVFGGVVAAASEAMNVVAKMLITLNSALEDGNRRIFRDVGGCGFSYLVWRAHQRLPIGKEAIFEKFAVYFGRAPVDVRACYNFAMMNLDPQPTNLETALKSYSSNDMMVAAIALYEEAAHVADTDTVKADRMIKFANMYMAFREQHDAAQPAFDGGGTKQQGEVERLELFQLMTPTIKLQMQSSLKWTHFEYCTRKGFDIMTKNWGIFADRWDPILDAFEAVYKAKSGIWPMPPSDAHTPL